MRIKQNQNTTMKNVFNVLGTVLSAIVVLYAFAFMFTMFGVATGAISENDNSELSKFIRATVQVIWNK